MSKSESNVGSTPENVEIRMDPSTRRIVIRKVAKKEDVEATSDPYMCAAETALPVEPTSSLEWDLADMKELYKEERTMRVKLLEANDSMKVQLRACATQSSASSSRADATQSSVSSSHDATPSSASFSRVTARWRNRGDPARRFLGHSTVIFPQT